jgi:FkbM family methyltransferase
VLTASELTPLLPCLRPDDVFLDVGVHAGSWSVPASRALTAGQVYAFEAFPYYARVLKATLKLLGRRNVTVVVGAVSDAPGELAIVWRDSSGQRLTGMTHISRGSEAGDTVRVRALTIDDYCREHAVERVRLMKCDVEGAELMVLRGATATIDRWRPFVFCELYEMYCSQYGYAAADVFSFFSARRYRSMRFDRGVFRPLEPGAYASAGDVLFVPIEMEFTGACA